MIFDQELFDVIGQKYDYILPQIQKIERYFKIQFLQELKVVVNKEGTVIDIVLLVWDVEGFSYKTSHNTLLIIGVFEKFFPFESSSIVLNTVKNLLFINNTLWWGIDQYICISLLSYKIVWYYGIIWWAKPIDNRLSLNFNIDYFHNLHKDFPFIFDISGGTPWNFYIWQEHDTEIIKKIYFYETSNSHFQSQLKPLLKKWFSNLLSTYLETFHDVSSSQEHYWKDYISWNWYNESGTMDSFTMEFFLRSSYRARITSTLNSSFETDRFSPYIVQVNPQSLNCWFLINDSFLLRKQAWYYKS